EPMLVASIGLIALALLGHAALWVGINNRWHGTGFPRKVVKSVTPVSYSLLLFLPPVLAWHFYRLAQAGEWSLGQRPPLEWAGAYVVFCAAFGAVHLPLWTWWRLRRERAIGAITVGPQEIIDVCQRTGGPPTTS